VNDRSRPKGTASETPAKKSATKVAPRNAGRYETASQRRARRERDFAADVVAYLESLDRRRDAEWRLQRIADFVDVA
jgi:hypothetical protein